MLRSCWVSAREHFGDTSIEYEEEGMDGLNDKRLSQASHRRAPVDEVD
jgi:hypothetical protein